MTNHSLLGPSIWAVSDGRAGNAAQVRAIIAALTEPQRWLQIAHIQSAAHRTEPLTLSPRAPWTWLPGANWPAPRFALPQAERTLLTPPWPSLWIAAGRRSAPYTAAVRKWSAGQTVTVQILDPKRTPEDFDLIVVPEHDTLRSKNTLTITGSPTHFSETDIEESGQRFADLADLRTKSLLVVLGGNSIAYRFTQANADLLMSQLNALSEQGWRLRITTSRRTPLDIAAQIRQFAARIGATFWSGPQDGENPYLAWLIYSDAAIVTSDSTNMLSDVAWHGLPLHIAPLDGGAAKFDGLHQSLIATGAARPFTGQVETWSYAPLREADRVADRIIDLLLQRFPKPQYRPETA